MPQSLTLHFEVAGEVQIRRRFEGILGNVEDLSPAFERMADALLEYEKEVFQSEGSANPSGGWKPLSEQYKRWKDKHYPGRRILERTGELEKVMTTKGASGASRDITAQQMVLRFRRAAEKNPDRDLASTHHTGGKGGRPPRRRVLEPSEKLKRRWVQIIREHLNTEGAKGAVRSKGF